jgi:ABC-type sugar transport system ATPase subunit
MTSVEPVTSPEVRPSTAALAAQRVQRRFGGVHALRDANLVVGDREIHGLVGENGSGKSTLLKILSGQLRPDAGRILLDGQEVTFPNPALALAGGIAMVTQERTLVSDLSVAENVFLGHRQVKGGGRIDWKSTRREAAEVLRRLNVDIDPKRVVGSLRPDQQQMVEIARALSFETRILILDEPTSSLTDDEVHALFQLMRRLQDSGVATIFVSHRLAEIFDVCDRLTVLRDGVTVSSGSIANYDRVSLIEDMVGRRVEHEEADVRRSLGTEHHNTREARTLITPLLRVRGLSVSGLIEDVDLDVRAGEIVGLAGLVGAGRSELLESLFGLHRGVDGEVEMADRRLLAQRPGEAMGAGLAYVPPDRKLHGLVLDMTVRENMLMARTAGRPRILRPVRRREVAAVARASADFHVRAPSWDVPVGTLSGGNQQKVVLSKWLITSPRLLLLDEPTRGVDVGAKPEIYRLLQEAKDQGLGILVSSSETPELLLLCDRIIVMFRGRIVASLDREEATEARIAHFATGHAA